MANKSKKIDVIDLDKIKDMVQIDMVEEGEEKIDVKIDIEGVRETTARNLSIIMVGIFILIIAIPIFRPSSLDYIKDVLPCVTTLLGASFGFYFSEKRLG